MKKEVKKIFLILILYSIASGIFLNFQEFWLLENNLSVSTIGIILSVGTMLSVGTIFLFSNYIGMSKIKNFMQSILLFKFCIMIILYFLNMSNQLFLIKLLIMVDYILDVEFLASVYPLISIYVKDDKVFALKEIIYDTSYNIGILITGFLIGKSIGKLKVSYNSFFLISAIITLISWYLLKKLNIKKIKQKNDNNSEVFYTLVKKISKNNIIKNYCFFILFNCLAYYTITGMAISFMTIGFGFSASFTSNWKIVCVMLSSILGFICLYKLSLKNDHIAVFIKFGIRIILYGLGIILNNRIIWALALTYTLLTCDLFIDLVDGKYVNYLDSSEQLSFANYKEMLTRFGKGLGILLCSVAIKYGIKFDFLMALIFSLFQVYFLNKAIKYNKEQK